MCVRMAPWFPLQVVWVALKAEPKGFWVIVMQSDLSIVTKNTAAMARMDSIAMKRPTVVLAISLHVPLTKPQGSGPSQT